MRFVVATFVGAAFVMAGSAATVRAQVDSREGIALQNQIYQLRQELKSYQDQAARSGSAGSRSQVYSPPPQPPGGSDLLAQLLTRVDALEDQVRQLRGRIDETQNQLRRQNDSLSKRIDDLTFQTSTGQTGTGQTGTGQTGTGAGTKRPASPAVIGGLPADPDDADAVPPPPPVVSRPPAQAVPRTPELVLQEGNAALNRRDYAGAETAARSVLANRTSAHAYDAQLLLAQALAGQRQYAQAAIAFDDAYNRSRKGTRAPDALLGLANSLTAINEKKAACDTLTRLRTDFPQPRAEIGAGATAATQKAGCR